MSDDAVDLTLLGGRMHEMARELRFVRLQLDQLTATVPPRLAALEQSYAALERSSHELTSETARGFGQVQQQQTRMEQRLNAVADGLASINRQLGEQASALADILAAGRPSR